MDPKKKALFDILNRWECPIWGMDPDRLLEMADYLIRCGVTISAPEETKRTEETE
jgi:hypothetical protein